MANQTFVQCFSVCYITALFWKEKEAISWSAEKLHAWYKDTLNTVEDIPQWTHVFMRHILDLKQDLSAQGFGTAFAKTQRPWRGLSI